MLIEHVYHASDEELNSLTRDRKQKLMDIKLLAKLIPDQLALPRDIDID